MSPHATLHGEGPLRLRLYVCGNTPNSLAAIRNITAIETAQPPGRVVVEIIDVAENQILAVQDRIVITPTLLLSDHPHVRVLGNLSDAQQVLAKLQL